MDEIKNNGGADTGAGPDNIENWQNAIERRWIVSGFVRNGVIASSVLSIALLALYIAGSVPDTGFSDNALFLILRLLRYSSLLLCAFSLFAMAYSVHRMVNTPCVKNFFRLFFYFIIGLSGAALATLYSFIVAASEGNV